MIAKPPVFLFIIPIPKDLTYIPFRFFFLLDLIIFSTCLRLPVRVRTQTGATHRQINYKNTT